MTDVTGDGSRSGSSTGSRAAVLAWGLLEAVYSVYDRARPEEVVEHAVLNGHSWAHLNSFPSGHMAITAALGVAVALAFPRLRFVLWAPP